MAAFVVLLRAVNVGGTAPVPMPAFRAACEQAGLQNPSTHLASGNLVCRSDAEPAEVRAIVATILEKSFQLTGDRVFVRSLQQWEDIAAGNPFPDAAADRPGALQVHVFDDKTPPGALDGFTGPERIHVSDQRLYIDYPNGIGRSKLTQAVLDRALRVPSTGRNWNTVLRLRDKARSTAEL
jgi:uncharacterized protein (DUF1697 family)